MSLAQIQRLETRCWCVAMAMRYMRQGSLRWERHNQLLTRLRVEMMALTADLYTPDTVPEHTNPRHDWQLSQRRKIQQALYRHNLLKPAA